MVLQMQVVGHVGQDATVTEISGKKAVNFSVAHTERYTTAQGVKTEKTTWISCTYWNGEAVAPYIKKGIIVHLQGQPEAVVYTTKSGENRADLRLRVATLKLLSSPTDKPQAPTGPQQAAPAAVAPDNGDDDLPF